MAETPEFHIRFWGVRGSIPCPGEETAKYGGNTSCVEIKCGERVLVFDAGTGICQFAESNAGAAPLDVDLFLTHTHYDHVWGWPHFSAALSAKNKFHIRAGHLHDAGGIENLMRGLLTDPLNPVNTETLRAKLTFEDFGIGDTLAPRTDIKVRTAALNHPNGASGYRVEFAGKAICYITDHEHTEDGPTDGLLALVEDADIMVYDATYTDEEFPNHVNWGHSTWQEGARLSDKANVAQYVVFHHDPGHDDSFMDQVARDVERMRPGSIVAREGMILSP